MGINNKHMLKEIFKKNGVNDDNLFEQIDKLTSIDSLIEEKYTLLEYAINNKLFDVVEYLVLSERVNVNIFNINSENPLYMAYKNLAYELKTPSCDKQKIIYEYNRIIKILKENGANIVGSELGASEIFNQLILLDGSVMYAEKVFLMDVFINNIVDQNAKVKLFTDQISKVATNLKIDKSSVPEKGIIFDKKGSSSKQDFNEGESEKDKEQKEDEINEKGSEDGLKKEKIDNHVLTNITIMGELLPLNDIILILVQIDSLKKDLYKKVCNLLPIKMLMKKDQDRNNIFHAMISGVTFTKGLYKKVNGIFVEKKIDPTNLLNGKNNSNLAPICNLFCNLGVNARSLKTQRMMFREFLDIYSTKIKFDNFSNENPNVAHYIINYIVETCGRGHVEASNFLKFAFEKFDIQPNHWLKKDADNLLPIQKLFERETILFTRLIPGNKNVPDYITNIFVGTYEAARQKYKNEDEFQKFLNDLLFANGFPFRGFQREDDNPLKIFIDGLLLTNEVVSKIDINYFLKSDKKSFLEFYKKGFFAKNNKELLCGVIKTKNIGLIREIVKGGHYLDSLLEINDYLLPPFLLTLKKFMRLVILDKSEVKKLFVNDPINETMTDGGNTVGLKLKFNKLISEQMSSLIEDLRSEFEKVNISPGEIRFAGNTNLLQAVVWTTKILFNYGKFTKNLGIDLFHQDLNGNTILHTINLQCSRMIGLARPIFTLFDDYDTLNRLENIKNFNDKAFDDGSNNNFLLCVAKARLYMVTKEIRKREPELKLNINEEVSDEIASLYEFRNQALEDLVKYCSLVDIKNFRLDKELPASEAYRVETFRNLSSVYDDLTTYLDTGSSFWCEKVIKVIIKSIENTIKAFDSLDPAIDSSSSIYKLMYLAKSTVVEYKIKFLPMALRSQAFTFKPDEEDVLNENENLSKHILSYEEWFDLSLEDKEKSDRLRRCVILSSSALGGNGELANYSKRALLLNNDHHIIHDDRNDTISIARFAYEASSIISEASSKIQLLTDENDRLRKEVTMLKSKLQRKRSYDEMSSDDDGETRDTKRQRKLGFEGPTEDVVPLNSLNTLRFSKGRPEVLVSQPGSAPLSNPDNRDEDQDKDLMDIDGVSKVIFK